jgi:hypothetical protein
MLTRLLCQGFVAKKLFTYTRRSDINPILPAVYVLEGQ